MKKFVILLTSLASLLALCKPVLADDTPKWVEGFTIGGYSSAGITLPRDEQARAALNEVSLLVTWNGDSRWSFFGELELENPISWDDDRQFHTKESKLDLERFYLDYNLSEQVNFRVGRFLTPNSRWNLLHASPLVWTSTRPLATSRLFPTGTNGAMVFGAIPFMEGALEYKLFAELLEDQKLDNNELDFEHVRGARFSFKNQSDVGVSILAFRENGIDNSYRMLGLDFVTHINHIEISGEAFKRFDVRNKDGGSGTYLQSAVPLISIGMKDWYWITRYETLQRPNEGSAERWLVGATWRVKPTQLLKFEFTGGSGNQPEAPGGFLTSFALFF
jgi:hypothetical protein